MHRSIEYRVSLLEAKASAADGALKFVWREKGATQADALQRAGHSPANAVRVLVFSWLDAKL